MGSIAEGFIPGLLAAAKIKSSRLFGPIDNGTEIRHAVRTIAEWLFCTPAASAPEIALTGLHLDLIRSLLGDFRLGHLIYFVPNLAFRKNLLY